MAEIEQAALAVRSLIEERHGDKVSWGTLPWLVDRVLDSVGGGVGLAPNDMLELELDEVQAAGALFALFTGPDEVEAMRGLLYDEE